MTDLVERLRDQWASSHADRNTLLEASDEIERLRSDLEVMRLQRDAKRWTEGADYRKAIMQIHEQRHGFADATSAVGWIYDKVDEVLGADDE